MEIRHLKLVEAVAATQNLTRAAEQLFLSQSALSHQLKELEEELGMQVFIRARRKMLLTPAGERLLETAKKVLCELEKAETAIANLRNGEAGILRLTTGCYTCYHWLSPVLADFQKEFPDVEVDIAPDATYDSTSHLLEGKLDLVLISDREENANLQYQPIFEDRLVAFMPPDHPWAAREHIEAGDFTNTSLIMYSVSDNQSTILNDFFKPAGVSPKKLLRLQLTEAIVEMVKAGVGIGILAEWAVKPYADRGEVQIVPLRPSIRRTWYAVTLKNQEEPSYLKAFIQLLKREIPVKMCCVSPC
jgi:LysR family transcriptional regulator for metE and metH